MKTLELLKEMADCEKFTNKDRHVGTIKYILMHPSHFMELASDRKSLHYLSLEEGNIRFAGIPLIRTTEIERVDFCI